MQAQAQRSEVSGRLDAGGQGVADNTRQAVQRQAGQHGFPEIQLGAAENALFEEICNYLHTLRPQAEAAYSCRAAYAVYPRDDLRAFRASVIPAGIHRKRHERR